MAYQGWMQRNPEFCLTFGGKVIMNLIKRDINVVIDFVKSKEEEIDSIDEIIKILQSIYPIIVYEMSLDNYLSKNRYFQRAS